MGNMLEWHDCKSDPPKEDGHYILITCFYKALFWEEAYWSRKQQKWRMIGGTYYGKECCYKWAEIELPE